MTIKNARLDLKTTKDAKETIEKAAHILGTTLSAFMLDSSIVRARQILAESERICLNIKESNRFISALENPPPPNKKLQELFNKHNT